MNYDQARMIGQDGPAPGKWNWTTMNDHVIWTTRPCFRPDMDWDAIKTDGTIVSWSADLTGRERCDHDTREEAERHHYEDAIAHVRIEEVDLTSAREIRRCDVAACRNWQTHVARWPDGYGLNDLCDDHATIEDVRGLHPFIAGLQEIHS